MNERIRAGALTGASLTTLLAATMYAGWRLAGLPFPPYDLFDGLARDPGTPADIVGALYRESTTILAQPEMKERLPALGYEVVASTPEEFAVRIKTEIDMWAKVIRAANIKAE